MNSKSPKTSDVEVSHGHRAANQSVFRADPPASRQERPRQPNTSREVKGSLRQQVQGLRDIIQSLEAERSTLKDANTQLVEANRGLEEAHAVLQDENEALRKDISAHDEKSAAWKREKQKLEEDIGYAQTRISTLEDENLSLDSERSALHQQKLNQDQHIESLQKQISDIENARLLLENDKTALENDKTALEKTNVELQDSWERMNTDNTRLRAAFEDQLEKTRVRSLEVESLSAKISNLDESLAVLDAAKREADNSLQLAAEENARQDQAIQGFTQQLKTLGEEFDEASKRCRALETQLVCLKAEKEGLEQELAPLQAENQKLADQTAEQQALIARLEAEHSKMDTSLQDARDRLDKQDERTYSLSSDLGKVTAERDLAQLELAKDAEGREALTTSLRKEKTKVIKLETELGIAQATMQDARITNAQLSETERSLRDRVLHLQRSLSKISETTDASKATQRALQSEIASLQSQLANREKERKMLRSSLKASQRSLAEATDRISTLETDQLAKEQRIDTLRHRLADEGRLRSNATRDLRLQRVRQKELEALEETAGERIAEAERRATTAAERADDLTRDAAAAKDASAILRQRLSEMKLELARVERRLVAEEEKARVVRVELQEVNRVVDGLDPERTWRQLADEKAARSADVARLQAEMATKEAELAAERVKVGELGGKVKILEATGSHAQCVERTQVRDMMRTVGDLVSQCEVRPRGQRYEWCYPEQLIQRPEDDKWEVKFVKKVATRRRW